MIEGGIMWMEATVLRHNLNKEFRLSKCFCEERSYVVQHFKLTSTWLVVLQ